VKHRQASTLTEPWPSRDVLWHRPGGMRAFGWTDSVACIVAETLAHAVARGIPLAEALRHLPFYVTPKLGPVLSGVNRWTMDMLFLLLPRFWSRQYPLSLALEKLIEQTDQGESLSYALETSLADYLPAYYILGVEKAEREGRLESVLPVLAESLAYPRFIRDERLAALRVALLRAVVLVPLLLGISTFIMPRFGKMVEEITGGASGGHSYLLLNALLLMVIWGGLLAALVLLLSKIFLVREYFWLRTPFLRRSYRRVQLVELIRALLAFLRSGEDMVSAARWAQRGVRSPWLQERIGVFVGAMESGVDWAEAWRRMAFGVDDVDWVVHNAMVRESPVEGLEMVLDKLFQDVQSTTRRWAALADPVCVVVLATPVAYFAFRMFSWLILIVEECL
jgi:type II secretory pathway component PulF